MATSVSIFNLADLGAAPASNDVTVIVDISDPSQSPQGTTKKILISELFTSVTVTTSLTVNGTAKVTGASSGVAAFAGDFYNHAMVTVGYDNGGGNINTLSATHQVGVLIGTKGNANATGAGSFIGGVETQLGTNPGATTLERMAAFAVGSVAKGAGSTITQIIGLKTVVETAGTNNAAISTDTAVFSGNWFLYDDGTRPWYLGGAGSLTGPTEVFRSIATDFMRVSGGDGGGFGANILMFGQTHASNANKMQLNASVSLAISSAAVTMSGTLGVTGVTTATGGLTLGASTDLTLPGGGFGIANLSTRFLAIASGANPLLTFSTTGGQTNTGQVVSTSATAGIGYATGAGGAVTQSTDKSTGVTLNTVTGAITMNNANLLASAIVSFTVTNSAVKTTDTIHVNHVSAGTAGSYNVQANHFINATSFAITVQNITGGGLAEAIVLNYTIVRGASS